MEFPSTIDFLEAFGIEPVEEDENMAFCRYIKQSTDKNIELDISFSAVGESFQVIMRAFKREVIVISSEKAKIIEIWRKSSEVGLRVIFDFRGEISEAVITLEPEPHCRWWILRN